MNQDRSGWMIALPTLTVWVLSVIGVVSSTGYVSSSGRTGEAAGPMDNTVIARMWEDPISAVGAEDYKTAEEMEKDEKRFGGGGGGESAQDLKADKLVIVVVRGQPFEDDREWRRRMRYALESAFWSYGWSPAKGGRLGYYDLPPEKLWPGATVPAAKNGKPAYALRVPYERFVGPGQGSSIRVLWVNQARLDHEPLRLLAELTVAVTPEREDEVRDAVIIGPAGSDALAQMIWEQTSNPLRKSDPQAATPALPRVRFQIWSPWATGDFTGHDNQSLREFIEAQQSADQDPPPPEPPSRWKMDLLDWQGCLISAALHRTTPTDTALLEVIHGELVHRGIRFPELPPVGEAAAHPVANSEAALKRGAARTVLLAEWDTSFGRAFVKSARQRIDPAHVGQPPGSEWGDLEVFYYLRGLDGAPPTQANRSAELDASGAKAAAAQANANNPNAALGRLFDPKPQPLPRGPRQSDYLVRLADQIVESDLEERLRGREPIRAVGIVSTDLVDRLLLLKALRTRLPDALFFTTELEADYLLPEHNSSCCNLLVASCWPLNDSPALRDFENQGNREMGKDSRPRLNLLPPFRDDDQRALVHALRPLLAGWDAVRPPPAPKAQVFEVGLRHFYPLSPPRGSDPGAVGEGKNYAPSMLSNLASLLLFLTWLTLLFYWGWEENQLGLWPPKARGGSPAGKAPTIKQQLKSWLGAKARTSVVAGSLFAMGVAIWLSGWAWGGLAIALLCLATIFILLPQAPRALAKPIHGWLVIIFLIVVVSLLIRLSGLLPGGEPFALADGMSLWPAVGLRLAAVLLACWFIWQGRSELIADARTIDRDFFTESTGHRPLPRQFPQRQELPYAMDQLDRAADRLLADHEHAEWDRYCADCNPDKRANWRRWAGGVLVAFVLSAMLMLAFGMPTANTRGTVAELWDGTSLTLSLLAFFVLVVFVIDQALACRRFLPLIYGHGLTAYGFEVEESINLIARRSAAVGRLVQGPFSVAFVLACAHTRFLENWSGLFGLHAVLICALSAVFYAIFSMERAAEAVRTSTRAYLLQRQIEATWVKRLLLQRVDFDELSADFLRGTAVPDWSPERAPELARRLHEWWQRTLERLCRHLSPPEVPRFLTALEHPPLLPAANPAVRLKALEEYLKPYRDLDISFYSARIDRIERLLKTIADIREGAFGRFWERPILPALLLPGAGFGSIELLLSLLSH